MLHEAPSQKNKIKIREGKRDRETDPQIHRDRENISDNGLLNLLPQIGRH